jgi:hypothetical protein
MSKRFGRNQKRRMREQIETLEKDLHNHKCWLYQERQLAARNREIVAETAHVLGRHFITLEPSDEVVQSLDALAGGWRAFQYLPDRSYSIEQIEPTSQTIMETVLPVLWGSMHADHLSQFTHFRFTYAGKEVGYAITKEALGMLPPAWKAKRIAGEMTRQLISQLWEVPA